MNPEKKQHSYDIIIPVCKPGREFERLLEVLKKQEPAPSKIILLETLEEGEALVPYRGCEVVKIRKEDFDHASTRRLGVSYSWSDAFIFLTQDAMPADTQVCAKLLDGLYAWEKLPESELKKEKYTGYFTEAYQRSGGNNTFSKGPALPAPAQTDGRKGRKRIKAAPAINSTLDMDPDTSSWDNVPRDEYVRLIREHEKQQKNHPALQDGRIAMCYGRQIAAETSSEAEKFTRSFNYPDRSCTKSIADIPALGIKALFASNVCCAYNRDIYEGVMGFESNAIFNEDMLYAAKVLKQGFRIAYAADAAVIHSHNYTAMQQFHRMFDNGMSQAMHPEVFAGIASEGEGKKLVKETIAHLIAVRHPLQVIPLLWQSAFRYFGFRMGKNYAGYSYRKLRRLAMNKTYIDRHFKEKRGS